jgi:hypothetical protein
VQPIDWTRGGSAPTIRISELFGKSAPSWIMAMKQQTKKERITKEEFYRWGGFKNSELFRLQSRGGAWRYYRKVS